MGQAASFVVQVERAALSVNQISSQAGDAVFIMVVTACKHEPGILGVPQLLSLWLKHTTS